jgi:APA family basic amino acid/polyamine antiporter
MVLVKIAAILIFVFGAAHAVKSDNWHPFLPNGFPGVLTGAAIVFFTYIGFDSVSTAAEECTGNRSAISGGNHRDADDLRGALHRGFAGADRHRQLQDPEQRRPGGQRAQGAGLQSHSRMGERGRHRGHAFLAAGVPVRAGAHLVRHVARWAAARRFFEGPPAHKTPHISTWIAGLVVGIPAGIWDIGTFADLANIGTLFAFIVVSAGVIVLRRQQPDRPRGFRVPGSPFLPALSIVSCLVLMMALPLETWLRFVVWLVIGFAIYFPFGRKHSIVLRKEAA